MTYAMATKITFPAFNGRRELVIRKVSEVHTSTTYKQLVQTGEIVLPRNIKFFDNDTQLNKSDIRKIFRAGDPVIIEMGYGTDENLVKEFEGYVGYISADVPIKIKLEDEMWNLKKIKVNYSSANVTLSKLLADICPNYKIDALEGVSLGAVRFANTTVHKVLEKLTQDPWHLYSYFDGKTLVSGKYYSDDTSLQPASFVLEKMPENNLVYKSNEVPLKITGKSILPDGKKLEASVGEDGGDIMTLSYYNIPTVKELETKIQIDYDRRKAGGYSGSFSSYGRPSVKPGMKADITSNRYPDRSGLFYIEAVNKDFVAPKYRQVIKLGGKVQ